MRFTLVLAIILIIVLVLLIAFTVGFFIFGFYVSDKNKKQSLNIPDGGYFSDIHDAMVATRDEIWNYNWEKVTITSELDGTILVGRLFMLADENAPIVIGCHGYHGTISWDGFGFYHFAKKYGRNLLLIEQRAHGESGSRLTTFGIKERVDVGQWCHYVADRFGDNCKIILGGVSMGAATVMMASTLKLPEQVKCIIEDCGYTSPADILKNTAKGMGVPADFSFFFVNIVARLAGINLKAASAIEAMEKNTIPMLFIHGAEDDFVPTNMVYALYDACHSPKDILIVDGARHATSAMKATETYIDKINEFTQKYL